VTKCHLPLSARSQEAVSDTQNLASIIKGFSLELAIH
jgi:hypothetical protein